MGASSFSPSPITTTPRIETLSSTKRMASTAAWSALSFSPRPIQRAAAIAPASVTRTSSSAMLRSGACRALTASHPFRCLDPDEVETACDHGLGRAAEAEPERFLLALEHAVLVVEAVEVGVDADLVHEGVEEDDVAAPSRHARLLAALRQVDHLVEEHLHPLGAVAEHPGDGRVPVARAVVVGAEDVDRPIEAALELVDEVGDVGGA